MTNSEGKGGGDHSLARRALRGLGKRPDPQQPAPEPSRSERPGEGQGGDVLARLVGALKNAPGAISAVEPEGYVLFDRHRDGRDPLGPGAAGEIVDVLQRLLRRLGCDAPDSGRYDAKTEAAVRAFQGKQGLPGSGTCDEPTIEAFDRALGVKRPAAGEHAFEAPRSMRERNLLPPTGNPFMDRIVPGAVRGMHATGVPASVSIAMAVVESDWGQRLLARDYHNVFAVKGKGPAGSVFMRGEDEPSTEAAGGTAYRSYDDDAQAVEDHARLLAGSAEYRGLLAHRAHAENFARALSGLYSPNPGYGSLLVRLMRQYDLGRYDRVPAPPTD